MADEVGKSTFGPWMPVMLFVVQAAVILVSVTWQFGIIRSDLNVLSARVEENGRNLARLDLRVESQMRDRYTGKEAEHDRKLIVAQIQIRDDRITQLVTELARLDKMISGKPPKWIVDAVTKLQAEVRRLSVELRRTAKGN